MDFFSSQDQARKRTGWLVFFYAIAVALIILSTYLVVLFAFGFFSNESFEPRHLWDPFLFFWIAGTTILIISLGSGYRILQLRSGGAKVAEIMGGRRIDPSTKDPSERRLVKIVEEMAIASGVPVPEIFVMDAEQSINAFAAGYSPGDAAVAVTAGTLHQLNRDELQGVIAHEFSHILNGDMRLNIRLIGVLNGILIIHLIGLLIVRSLSFRRIPSSQNRKGGGSGGLILAIIIIGIALMIIGYIGVIFSRIIQAAISRQREYLADSSAVQFTRNPDGIANALKKIGAATEGSRIQNAHANELGHLFFANGVTSLFSGMFATHPPLIKRIRAIDPGFDGKTWISPKPKATPPPIPASKPAPERKSPFSPITETIPVKPKALFATIGTIGATQIEQAGELLRAIPTGVAQAARNPESAEAVIQALLLSNDPESQKLQIQVLKARNQQKTSDHLSKLLPQILRLPAELRLPLMELTLPALRKLTPDEFRRFNEKVDILAKTGNGFSIFQLSLLKVLRRNLERQFQNAKQYPAQNLPITAAANEAAILLSALAHSSDDSPETAFQAGATQLPNLSISLLPAENTTLSEIDKALDKLGMLSYPGKKQFLTAALGTISSDGKINPAEAEIFRAIAATLDIPIPPITAS